MGFPPGSRGAIVCQFAAYQPEKASLSRRTVDCRVIFIFCGKRNRLRGTGAKRPARCCIRAIAPSATAAPFRPIPVTSRPRHRMRKYDLDQRAGTAAGLDLAFGAVAFATG